MKIFNRKLTILIRISGLTTSYDKYTWTCKTKKISHYFCKKMADLANFCDQKCKIWKLWIESWPFWLEWVVWRLDMINLSGLAKPKKSAIIFAKMADLANSCDPKCGICKFWIESWPFWLKWVVWWHHMTNVSKLAKPKKISQFFCKNGWFSH